MRLLRTAITGTIITLVAQSAMALCPIAQHEMCTTDSGTTEFQNCLIRNQREDARFYQCMDEERQERQEQEQERQAQAEQDRKAKQQEQKEQQEEENYCRQHPDDCE